MEYQYKMTKEKRPPKWELSDEWIAEEELEDLEEFDGEDIDDSDPNNKDELRKELGYFDVDN